MSVQSSPAPPKRKRRVKLTDELRILKRDGLVRYLRGRILLARFHRSVRRMS